MAKSTPKPADRPRSHDFAPHPAIRIPKTAEVVAAHIRKSIIRGDVKAGDSLPPEAQLVAHFGASRPSIREAYRILESEQLISVTRGSRTGAKVHAPSVAGVARYAGFALQAQGTLLSDVYLARLAVEPFAVRLAAERASGEEIATLRAGLDKVMQLSERHESAEFRVALVRLHRALVELSGSNTLVMIWAMLEGVLEQHMSRFKAPAQTGGHDGELGQRRLLGGLRSIGKVIDLIRARDADGAEAHWREHMRNANATWLLGYDQTGIVDVVE